ncbi:MAG: cell division protein FtsW [Ruminococcus sp.]|nr:cell division protein FtsW [Ruminococcus sp.]
MASAKTRKRKKSGGLIRGITGESRRNDISVTFLAYVMILIVVGLVMMSSASYAWAYSEHDGDGLYYAKRQGVFALLGIAGMLVLMRVDYHNFKSIKIKNKLTINTAAMFYVATALLLIAVLIWGGDEGGSMGAKRWIKIGPINFQPSEVAKLSLIIFFAASMERDGNKMDKLSVGIGKYSLILGVYVGLILLEKHISGIILISVIAISMILCGGANKHYFILLGLIAVGAVTGFIMWQKNIPGSYVAVRFKSWKDPFADVLNDTWQTANSIIAIGSGGLFGLGLGNSRQKYLYLPETKNDFVFPIVCEELGFVGAFAIIIVYFLLVVEGYSIAVRCKDRFGMLIAVGITTQIGIQTVLNLAVVSNLIPNTGISLPFFSYGGTALLIQLLEMGIMLNISQQRYYPPDHAETEADNDNSEKDNQFDFDNYHINQ